MKYAVYQRVGQINSMTHNMPRAQKLYIDHDNVESIANKANVGLRILQRSVSYVGYVGYVGLRLQVKVAYISHFVMHR